MQYIFLFLFLFSISVTVSQITISRTINPHKDQIEFQVPKPEPYDSLESFCKKNVHRHVGQTIYLKENICCKSLGYYSIPFYTKPFFGVRHNVNDIIYKPKSGNYDLIYSDYEQLKNKYFYVNKILSNANKDISSQIDNICLELVEKQSNDTLYLQINGSCTDYDKFLTIGYFEKLKKTNVGKEFYFLGNDKMNENNLKDFDSGGVRFDIPVGTILKCIDFSIQNFGNNCLTAIFLHQVYGKLFVLYHRGGWIKLESKEDHDQKIANKNQLVKKYGTKNARLIANRNIVIGFTKQMCIESWGEPDKVNKSSSWSRYDHVNLTKNKNGLNEEWIYSGTNISSYLYFENGILTKFQKEP